MLRLRVTKGELSLGEEVSTVDRIVTIGRERSCTLTLKEPTVSRQHGELTQYGDRLIYRDQNSRSGSRVIHSNGIQVDLGPLLPEQELFPGDILQLGEVELEIVEFAGVSRLDDSASDFTVVKSIRELPVDVGSVRLPETDQALLDNFLNLPHFHPTDEQEAIETLAAKIAQTWPTASCMSIVTLWDEAVGNSQVTATDIQHSAVQLVDQQSDGGISLSILNEVVQRNAALCFESPSLMPMADSVMANEMRSCICAPMLDDRGIFGFVQVYTRHGPLRPFGSRDLSVLSILAGVSSLVLRQLRAAQRESHLRTFASVGQVVAGMSHDARNILVSLGEFMNSLESEFPPLADSQKWQNVHEDFDFLRFLVQDTWSRITPHHREPQPRVVKLAESANETVARCVRYFIPEQQHKWVQVDNRIPPDLTVTLDAELLSVALFNAIKNSLDAYRLASDEHRAARARLELHGRRARSVDGEPYVGLAVVDDAGGIPLNVRQRLGRELVSTKGEMGSGLGTRIMLEAIQRLGGMTHLASSREAGEFPAGTCVVFHLPLDADHSVPHATKEGLQWTDDYQDLRQSMCCHAVPESPTSAVPNHDNPTLNPSVEG